MQLFRGPFVLLLLIGFSFGCRQKKQSKPIRARLTRVPFGRPLELGRRPPPRKISRNPSRSMLTMLPYFLSMRQLPPEELKFGSFGHN